MLNYVRRHSQSFFTKALLILIGLSFIIGFGMLSSIDQSNVSGASRIASVNGEFISNAELEKAYSRLYERYRQQMGELDAELLKKLNLRFQALNILINQTLIRQKAEALGLRIGDEEVLDVLREVPAFKDPAGNFSPKYYKAILAQQTPRINPADFEADQRRYLVVDKLQRFVQDSVIVTEEEALQEFIRQNTTVSADVLIFKPQDFAAKAEVSRDEAEGYYKDHADQFSTGERIKFEYIRLSPNKFLSDYHPSEEETRAWYTTHPDQFQDSEEQVKARHILLKAASDATPQVRAAVRQRIEGMQEQLKSGADFAELARSYSEDQGSGAVGGDLGWFAKGRMVPEFEKAAFATPEGQVSPIVETSFGFHLIKVEGHKMPGKQDFAMARSTAEQKVKAEKAEKQLTAMRTKVDEEVAAGKPLATIATDTGGQYLQDLWKANDPGNKIKYPEPIQKALQDVGSDKGIWTSFGGVHYWIRVLARLDSEPVPFTEAEKIIRQAVARDKSLTVAAESASDALAALKSGKSAASVAVHYGIRIQPTGTVNLDAKTIPGIGEDEVARRTLFSLTTANPVPNNPIRIGNDYYLFSLSAREDVTLEQFRSRSDEFMSGLRQKKQQEAWENWVRAIKKDADIKLLNAPADLMPEAG